MLSASGKCKEGGRERNNDRQVFTLHEVLRKGFSERLIFKQKLKRIKEVSHGVICVKSVICVRTQIQSNFGSVSPA
jgi:hypothetical protein